MGVGGWRRQMERERERLEGEDGLGKWRRNMVEEISRRKKELYRDFIIGQK